MDAQVVIGDRAYAVALQWAFAADKTDLARTLRRTHARTVVSHPSDDGLLYGCPDPALVGERADSLSRMPAAALVLAQLAPAALVHQTLPSGQVWVCAARDGLPLPGSDRIHTRVEAARAVEEFLSFQPGMPLYGDLLGAKSLESLFNDATAQMLRKSSLRPVRRGAVLWLSLILVAALAVSGYLFWRGGQRIVEAPVAQPAAPAVDVATLEAEYARQVARAVAEGREKMLTRPGFDGVAQQWIALVRSLPLSVSGYRPRQVECKPDACSVEWNWSAGVYDPAVLQRLPGKRVEAANPMDYATRVQTVIALAPPVAGQRTVLPADEVEPVLLSLGSTLRRNGARVEFSKADKQLSVNLPQLPAALQEARRARAGRNAAPEAAERSRLIAHEGRARLLVTGWPQIQTALGTMVRSPMTPERAVVMLSQGQINLQMEASYVVPLAP